MASRLVANMAQDEGLAAWAAALGASHRELLRQSDALSKLERDCLELMGRS